MASVKIQSPSKLLLDTALNWFNMKIAPMPSYGIEIIWEAFPLAQLKELDRVKPEFLKHVMVLHYLALNRLIYLLDDIPLFIEDLNRRLDSPLRQHIKNILESAIIRCPVINPEKWEPKIAILILCTALFK